MPSPGLYTGSALYPSCKHHPGQRDVCSPRRPGTATEERRVTENHWGTALGRGAADTGLQFSALFSLTIALWAAKQLNHHALFMAIIFFFNLRSNGAFLFSARKHQLFQTQKPASGSLVSITPRGAFGLQSLPNEGCTSEFLHLGAVDIGGWISFVGGLSCTLRDITHDLSSVQ